MEPDETAQCRCLTCGKQFQSKWAWSHARDSKKNCWAPEENLMVWVGRGWRPILKDDADAPKVRAAKERLANGLASVEPRPRVITALDAAGARVILLEKTSFKYLGHILNVSGDDTQSVSNRIAGAEQVARRLLGGPLKHASVETRLKVFNAVVLARVVYAAETWRVTARIEARLNTFYLRWLRRISGLLPTKDSEDAPLNYPKNQLVYEATKAIPLADRVALQRARFWGHTLRRSNAVWGDIPLTTLPYFATSRSVRSQLTALAKDAKLEQINPEDRAAWRAGVKQFATDLQTLRRQALEQ